MKTMLFITIGLIAVFSTGIDAGNGSLAKSTQQEVEKFGLQCDNSQIDNHCAGSNGNISILGAACPALLRAYLCNHKTSEEELQKVVQNFVNHGKK